MILCRKEIEMGDSRNECCKDQENWERSTDSGWVITSCSVCGTELYEEEDPDYQEDEYLDKMERQFEAYKRWMKGDE